MHNHDHRCNKCKKKFNIFSKTWEEQENAKCKNCGSTDTKRLITTKTPIVNSRGVVDYTRE